MKKTMGVVFLSLSLVCLVFFHDLQAAGLYYWKDKDGNVQISDMPPESAGDRERMKSVMAPEEPAASLERAARQKTAPSELNGYSQKDVTIYTNTT